MMSTLLGGASRVRQDLLRYFLARPDARGHASAVARALGYDAGGVSRELRALERQGVLTSELVGRSRVYRPAERSPVVKELRTLVRRTLGAEARLRQAVADVAKVREAWIFGSYASGTDRAGSDVDVLVVGEHDSDLLRRRFADAERDIDRDVNIVELSPADLRRLRKERDPFIRDVYAGARIPLVGPRA